MTDANHHLFRETQAAKALLANFADIIGEDAEFAADLVEGETSLNEAIDRAVQQMIDDRAAMNGLCFMIDELSLRRDRISIRMDHMRTMLAAALAQAGRSKIEHAAVTMTLRSLPQSVVVTDEAVIPSAYWKQPEPLPPKLDKRALLAALKALPPEKKIPGATLNNGGQTIALKWG